MWLFTTEGFFSVVADREDPDRLLVRARSQDDIEALHRLLPEIEPFSLEHSDYRWRAYVSRADWQSAMSQLVEELDYENFKNALSDRQGADRSHLYHEVWETMLKLQL